MFDYALYYLKIGFDDQFIKSLIISQQDYDYYFKV